MTKEQLQAVLDCINAVERAFVSDDLLTTGGNSAGIADVIFNHADKTRQGQKLIADAICRPGLPWPTGLGDGTHVSDLTEAVTYAGRGLHAIAAAIEEVATKL